MHRPAASRVAAVLAAVALASGCSDAEPREVGRPGDAPATDAAAPDAGTAVEGGGGVGVAPEPAATSTGEPAFAPDASRRGESRELPLAVGAARAVGEAWEVEVVGYDPDATEEVLAFNAGNEPPPDGEVFALARVRATYVGAEERANAFLELEWALVDDTGEEHTDADCGVLPDDLASQAAVPAGATVEGTICSSVPADRLGRVVLYLRPLLGAPATHVWWSAPPQGAGRVLEP